ncbi:hypothetical protein [Yoonia sp. BS5-3]|uniref:Uncharacterized protein n=1 Tax=Yoonia phaeophyticola TaxID=3137369 RepID=A0ABZ2V1B9_9RHOB
MDAETLENIVLFLRIGVVTVALWVASRIFDLAMGHSQRRADRNAFVRAIYAEVDFNTFDMTRFLNTKVPLSRFHGLFEQSEAFVPHITDARHTDVYRSRIDELHFVAGGVTANASLVGDLVRFYGELEKVVQQIEGLSKDSFKTISVPGKVGTVRTIYQTCAVCEALGTSVLKKMETEFPKLHLTRNESQVHIMGPEKSDIHLLRQRLSQLQSDLDRVNHRKHQSLL